MANRKLKKNRWKQKEDQLLRRCIRTGMTLDATTELLGRTREAVTTRKHILGIKKRFANPRSSEAITNLPPKPTKPTQTSPTPQENNTVQPTATVTNHTLDQIFKAARKNGMSVTITVQ